MSTEISVHSMPVIGIYRHRLQTDEEGGVSTLGSFSGRQRGKPVEMKYAIPVKIRTKKDILN